MTFRVSYSVGEGVATATIQFSVLSSLLLSKNVNIEMHKIIILFVDLQLLAVQLDPSHQQKKAN
jgi:hypothetical protein